MRDGSYTIGYSVAYVKLNLTATPLPLRVGSSPQPCKSVAREDRGDYGADGAAGSPR